MPATISELFSAAVEENGDRTAHIHRAGSEWRATSYAELGEQVRRFGAGLLKLGLQPGDRVAILANTRPEWAVADFALIGAGIIVVPIYQTSSPAECQYILENSGARAVIVEDAGRYDRIQPAVEALDGLEWVIAMDDTDLGDEVFAMHAIAASAEADDLASWDRTAADASPEQMLTYIYTSGTTGPPKGCMLTHGNYANMVEMVFEAGDIFRRDDRVVLFLPLAHTFARLIHFLTIEGGMELVFSNPLTVLDDLAETRPTILPSVPRVFEKAYNKVQARMAEATGPRAKLASWAMGVGRKRGRYVMANKFVPLLPAAEWLVAKQLVFSKIHQSFGGNVRLAVSGGAPLSREIHEFFLSAGIVILEGYGLTESTTALTLSMPDRFRTGSVGPALPRCELEIAEDGEILARGPHIFQGYYGNEEATREAIDRDGWLHTGDIGKLERGMLYITDRKKDIIVTAGGKNVAPQLLEGGLKAQSLISQALVHGDKRPFLTALITLDADDAAAMAEEHGLPRDMVDFIASDAVIDHVQAALDKVNAAHGRSHQVKRFRILPVDFTTESGELTASMKLKRKVVHDRYGQYIDEMYEDGAADAAAVTDAELVARHQRWQQSEQETAVH